MILAIGTGRGVNCKKLLLLSVNIFVSLRFVVVLVGDFHGDSDPVEF